MSITDELRTGGIYRFPSNRRVFTEEELTAIADRIDAEHERAMAAAALIAGVPITDEDMAEHGLVRLPVDADGEYIHAGDVLDGYGRTIEVVELRHGRSGWLLISRDGNGYDDTFVFTHHHKPTVEDVLQKLLEKAVGYSDAHTTVALNTIAEFASRLRLAGDAE